MIYKYNYGDFPLKVYPCKYWWVRYAVACTYFSELYDELRIAALKSKGYPTGYAYSMYIPEELKEIAEEYPNSKRLCTRYRIWVRRDGKEVELDEDSEMFKFIEQLIINGEDIHWIDCPFERDDQSKCPFYEPAEWTKDVPLEELRQRKGYDV
ncbi:MAG: hypothetical protein ACTSWA_05285 [Candidatus Thorarchaeota archaeon]